MFFSSDSAGTEKPAGGPSLWLASRRKKTCFTRMLTRQRAACSSRTAASVRGLQHVAAIPRSLLGSLGALGARLGGDPEIHSHELPWYTACIGAHSVPVGCAPPMLSRFPVLLSVQFTIRAVPPRPIVRASCPFLKCRAVSSNPPEDERPGEAVILGVAGRRALQLLVPFRRPSKPGRRGCRRLVCTVSGRNGGPFSLNPVRSAVNA